MIEYVVAAWLSTMLCKHSAMCVYLPPQGGMTYDFLLGDGSTVHVCVENEDKEIGANVAMKVEGYTLKVVIPPNAHPCKQPIS